MAALGQGVCVCGGGGGGGGEEHVVTCVNFFKRNTRQLEITCDVLK